MLSGFKQATFSLSGVPHLPTPLTFCNNRIGGSSQGKVKHINILKNPLFLLRACLVTGMTIGDDKQAFGDTRQAGSKADPSGDGTLVLSHLERKPCAGCRSVTQILHFIQNGLRRWGGGGGHPPYLGASTWSLLPQSPGFLWGSSTFWAAGTSFMEDDFSMDGGERWMVSGWFKCITFIVHFISIIIITSTPPQIIRH